jgi:hypothetical protein
MLILYRYIFISVAYSGIAYIYIGIATLCLLRAMADSRRTHKRNDLTDCSTDNRQKNPLQHDCAIFSFLTRLIIPRLRKKFVIAHQIMCIYNV